MLILTQSDEMNRSYSEDQRLPVNTITTRNITSCDDTRGTRPFPSEQANPGVRERAAPNLIRSIGTSWQDSPTLKETRATVISSGPSTITITSAISPADARWFESTRSYGKERRCSKLGGDSVENPRFSQEQGKKRRSYRLAGLLGDNMQNKSFSGDEGEGDDEAAEGSSQFCTSLEEERTGMTLANPVRSPSAGTAGRNPPATISAWEAGWNVTNAIQVRNLSHSQRTRKDERIINQVPQLISPIGVKFHLVCHSSGLFLTLMEQSHCKTLFHPNCIN